MIIPFYIELVFYSILFVALVIVGYGFYVFIYSPSRKLYLDLQSPPPLVGDVKEIVIDNNTRRKSVFIGLLQSDISLRLKGIEEPHLEIHFQKEKGLEEYLLTFKPHAKNKVFWKAPHTTNYSFLNEAVTVESREFIGHPAYIRIIAFIQNNRPIHYVEFELSVKYFYDSFGDEKMKFIFKVIKIYPGIDLKSRDKKGIYSFGKPKAEEVEALT
ncbi:MAG: hypothetical protein NZ853_10860 [Leptospiraceae bacterium]|nr:hypothetical protein [Leptospiraceae bacterium]MDW7977046.1 hypothetical protein [Leptospiraceae bacterium]